MSSELQAEPTFVPLDRGDDVKLDAGQPWPSAYRGSKYSLIAGNRRTTGPVVEWEYENLTRRTDPPVGLEDAMKSVYKSGGTGHGSFRITADREVLTKVHADNYPNVDEAPVSEGWIPVYLGRLDGQLDFDQIDNTPSRLNGSEIAVWDGLPANHGEEWVVSGRNNLIWKWKDYRFQSAFDHSDLVAKYRKFRRPAGRIHINEHGHAYVNINPDEVPPAAQQTISTAFDQWQTATTQADNPSAKRLVERRLQATSRTDDPMDGLLPMYIGDLKNFDSGRVPKAVVDDLGYHLECGRKETW